MTTIMYDVYYYNTELPILDKLVDRYGYKLEYIPSDDVCHILFNRYDKFIKFIKLVQMLEDRLQERILL